VFRPTGFADLVGKRVGIFGYGIEGRASARRLAALNCEVVIVDDVVREFGVLDTAGGGLSELAKCDVILKSPGISRHRDDIVDLENQGVAVTSALNLWLHDVDLTRVVGVTGTKGKSTTTSLLAFFLRCLGEEAHELGNIGQPPYDPDVDVSTGWLVLEVSSFQSVDLTVAPSIVVVTSLGSDHLDWHGSLEQYHIDKLTLTRAPGEHLTLIASSPELQCARPLMGGHVEVIPGDASGLTSALGLLGAHNDHNVGLALAACARATRRSLEEVRHLVGARAHEFVPLRGRLTLIASRDVSGGVVTYVDDGLATAPLPAIAALEVFADEPVALIAGGFDRGVDYEHLARVLEEREHVTAVIVMGPAGDRLAQLLGPHVSVTQAKDMATAVRAASDAVSKGGVVSFSPAAPSFDAYKNWAERSEAFAREVYSVADASKS
jgi:UDP-N-acetylmuramoyl-L-alanine---L-glutamate ligase